MNINQYSSKDSLLEYLRTNLEDDEYGDFALALNEHPLMTCELPEEGSTKELLSDFRLVSKAVLFSVINDFFDVDESESDDEENDSFDYSDDDDE